MTCPVCKQGVKRLKAIALLVVTNGQHQRASAGVSCPKCGDMFVVARTVDHGQAKHKWRVA